MVTNVLKAKEHATCAEALEIIDEYDVRSLPVVDDEDRVKGMVSIFQLGEFFIPKPREPRKMRKAATSVSAIIRTLNARVIHTVDEKRDEDLFVRVGAMNLHSFGSFHHNEDIPAKQSIIVVGDRHDIQEKSINLGVRLLVITGDLEVEKYIIDMARERGVCLIISPYDSATSFWAIRSATRLSRLIDERFMTLHADETVESARRKVRQNAFPSYFVVDDDERHSSAIRTRPCTSSNMQMSAESWPDCRHLPEQRQERRKKIHRTHRQLKLNSIAIQNFISESI